MDVRQSKAPRGDGNAPDSLTTASADSVGESPQRDSTERLWPSGSGIRGARGGAPPSPTTTPPMGGGGGAGCDGGSRWMYPATEKHPSEVRVRRATASELETQGKPYPAPLPRRVASQRLLDGYVDMLVPHFSECSLNLTGTYSDEYGYAHGLMLARNVQKDLGRFLRQSLALPDTARCCGVEQHRTGRKVLHFHALIAGHWVAGDCDLIEAEWRLSGRGYARAKLVSDRAGCVEYASKHLLKSGDADALDWWFPPRSRHERRHPSMPDLQPAPSQCRQLLLARSLSKRQERVGQDGGAGCSDGRSSSGGTSPTA